MHPLRVLLGDADPLVRRIVRDILQEAGITVVAEASDGNDIVRLANHYEPDVVLMDVVLTGLDGIEAVRRIVSASPLVRVVVFTRDVEPETGIAALRAGASGYVTKDADVDALPRLLTAVSRGEAAITRGFAATLIDRLRAMPEGQAGLRPVRSPLTPREWEVLDLLCDGRSTTAIADELFLSVETVRSHLKRVMRKLGVNSRAAAVAAAVRLRTEAGVAPGAGDTLATAA